MRKSGILRTQPRAFLLTACGWCRKVCGLLFGAIAQLGERLHGMQEVGGSIPPSSTRKSVPIV